MSKMYFLNCNPTYTTIYAATKYQSMCLSPQQKAFVEKNECFVNDLSRPTSAESYDYDFENENKKLKHILSPNPTFDDFRKATLVIGSD